VERQLHRCRGDRSPRHQNAPKSIKSGGFAKTGLGLRSARNERWLWWCDRHEGGR
jgi:hypothetical protein